MMRMDSQTARVGARRAVVGAGDRRDGRARARRGRRGRRCAGDAGVGARFATWSWRVSGVDYHTCDEHRGESSFMEEVEHADVLRSLDGVTR